MLNALAPEGIDGEAVTIARRPGDGHIVPTGVIATLWRYATEGKGPLVGLPLAWLIAWVARWAAEIPAAWQLTVVTAPLVAYGLCAVGKKFSAALTDWKIDRIRLQSMVDLADIERRQKAEKADSNSLAFKIADLTKEAARWQVNHTNATNAIQHLRAELDEANERADRAQQAVADAEERSAAAFRLLQDAETRSQNLQRIIEALNEEVRKHKTAEQTGISVRDATANPEPTLPT